MSTQNWLRFANLGGAFARLSIVAGRIQGDLLELNITQSRNGRWTVISVAGEIDLATAPALEDALETAIAEGHAAIAIDLDPVSFIDSSGLRALIGAHRRLEELDGSLTVIAGPGVARRLLEVAGVADTLHLVESVDRLVDADS